MSEPRTEDVAAPGGPANASLSALDEIDYGVILIRLAEPPWCNRAAKASLGKPGAPLRLGSQGVTAMEPVSQERLRTALHGALHEGMRRFVLLGSAPCAVPVAVIPVAASSAGPQAAMLVLGRPGLYSEPGVRWFSVLHGLTATEASVLVGLLEGFQARQIATRHGVAISTVRTQIASIMSKTSTRRVGDLVRHVAAMPPMRPLQPMLDLPVGDLA